MSEQSQFYKNLFERMMIAVFQVDQTGHIIEINDVAKQIFHTNSLDRFDQIFELPFTYYCVEGQPIQHRELPWVKCFQTGISVYDETICIEGVGQFKIHYKVKALLDSETVATVTMEKVSISERIQSSENQQFSLLIENIEGIAIQGYDEQRRVTFWNAASELLYGYSKDEAIGKKLEELIIPEPMIDSVIRMHRSWIDENIAIPSGELILKGKYGQDVPILSSHLMLEKSDGQKEMFCIDIDLAEIRRYQQAVIQSEQRFLELFDKSGDAIFVVDSLTGKYLDANLAAEDLTGYSLSQLIGMKTSDITPIGAVERLKQIKEATEPLDFGEVTYIRPDGSERIVLLTVFPIKDHKIFSIGKDITDRKQAEKRIKGIADLFYSLTTDMDQNIGAIVEKVHELVGGSTVLYNRLDRENHKLVIRYGINLPAEIQAIDEPDGHVCYETVIHSDNSYEYFADLQQTPFVKSDINVRDFGIKSYLGAKVMLDDEPVGSLVVVDPFVRTYSQSELDTLLTLAKAISLEEERFSNREKIKTARQRLSIILDSVPADIYVADAGTQEIMFMNEHMKTSFGGDFTGGICWEVFRNDNGVCNGCNVERLFSERRDTENVYVWEGQNPINGKWYLNHDRGATWLDGRKVLIQVASDISELKNAEKEKQQLETELYKRRNLDSIGTLAGGIAHDFNNLLTGIFGNVSMAKMVLSPSDKAYNLLQLAEKSMERAMNLTRQLLTFAKGGDPIIEALDITALILDVTRFNLSGSSVKLVTNFQEEVAGVKADKGQISQVVSNLTINAMQSMPSGGTLTISVSDSDSDDIPMLKDEHYVKLTFEDQGIGISEEFLDQIFDPYFTTKQSGSGLGLATVNSIIDKHDGLIQVSSVVGKGTVFTLYLPASDVPVVTPDATGAIETVDLPNAKILVMDDEVSIRETLDVLLGALGHDVTLTADGEEAVQVYKDQMDVGEPFHMVILDLTVPGGMGGKEAMEILLSIDPDAQIVVSSGYSTDPIMSHYETFGLKGVLMKPYRVEDLKRVIQAVLTSS